MNHHALTEITSWHTARRLAERDCIMILGRITSWSVHDFRTDHELVCTWKYLQPQNWLRSTYFEYVRSRPESGVGVGEGRVLGNASEPSLQWRSIIQIYAWMHPASIFTHVCSTTLRVVLMNFVYDLCTPRLLLSALVFTTFSTCRVSMPGRCHIWLWLIEISGVVLCCFALSR